MKTILTLLFFVPLIGFSQYQIWEQLGQDIDGEAGDDKAAYVSMNATGDRIAIGAGENDGNGNNSGHVRVFDWNGSSWAQLGQDIDGEAANDYSGFSTSMNATGDRIAIGANLNDGNGSNSGHVRVYDWNGFSWVQLGQDIDGEAAGDGSGTVSMNFTGNRVAIGGSGNDGNGTNAGHIRIFEWNGSSWVQLGLDIDGDFSNAEVGKYISFNELGDHIITGNPDYWQDRGRINVYQWDGLSWTQKGYISSGQDPYDELGTSVSINNSGNIIAAGAPGADGTVSNSGIVKVYQWDGTNWNQLGLDIVGESSFEKFGRSIDLNSLGNKIAIGATSSSAGIGNNTGRVSVFSWDGTNWNKIVSEINGESAHDHFGTSVSMNFDGDKIAIGAYGNNNSNGWDAGHVRVHSCSSYSTDSIVSCDSFTWINGISYTTSTNLPIDSLLNINNCDSIVNLNLTIINSNTGTATQIACNSYTWIDGNTYTSSTNTPTYTLSNAAGCDSVVTLNLTVNTVNSSITNTTPTLMADATGATYQWLDCNNNYAPIPGETNQSFTATANGSYAVEVTQNGCVDTSACEQVNNVGINENNSSITIHPNPTTGLVELQGINGSFKVDVYDYAGKYLKSTSRSTIDLSDYPSGIYLLKVAYGDNTEELRVVKE